MVIVTSEKRGGRTGARLAWAGVVLVGLLALALGVLSVAKVPYVVLRPGPVTNALGNTPGSDHELIRVESGQGVTVHSPARGALDFTTVSVQGGPGRQLSALGYLWAMLDDDAVIKPFKDVYPEDVSADEVQKQEKAMMAQSQDGAHIVAARAAGYPVTRRLGVAGVLESSPNKDVLAPGDDLRTLGTTPLRSSQDLHDALARTAPGQKVPVGITRNGKEQVVQATVTRKDGRNVLGIMVRYQYTTPVKVSFDAGRVGGPSAGLMFTLALYDKLTPGDLTGGANVAGTGTISPEGDVGPIGGIEYKLKGARKAGASWFLAPAANCKDVAGHEVADLRVVPVSTFGQAKTVLDRIARSETGGLPACPAA